MQIDVGRVARRAAENTSPVIADLAARLAVAEEVIEAQKALIAELQPTETEEAAP